MIVFRCGFSGFHTAIAAGVLAFSATLNTQADEQGIASATAGSYALGRRPNELFSFDTLRLFGDDIKYTFTSPARWDDSDWLEAGLLTASVAGTSVFDHGIKTAVQKNRTHGLDTFSKDFQRLGAEGSFVILGGFEAWHLADGNKQAGAVVIDGLSSSLIAAGIITPILKYSIGRARPNETDEAYRFRPFSGKDSFPSGHATQAFAVASVIAADYPEEGWMQVAAYASAGIVGLARIEQNRHFASDVVAGAIIGTVVGRAVVAHHNTPATRRSVMVEPFMDGRETGLLLSYDF